MNTKRPALVPLVLYAVQQNAGHPASTDPPRSLTFLIPANLSVALISHSLLSLISVKIHGLINAPLATMIPSTPDASISS
jgi:hypothetical protein